MGTLSHIIDERLLLKFDASSGNLTINLPGGVTYDIGIRARAYEGSNPDPKIWGCQNCISKF